MVTTYQRWLETRTYENLGIVRARPTGLQLAILAFEDKPVWARMAHVAYPLNEGRFALYELEAVSAICWKSHRGAKSENRNSDAPRWLLCNMY